MEDKTKEIKKIGSFGRMGSSINDWGLRMKKYIHRLEDKENFEPIHGEQRLSLRQNNMKKYRQWVIKNTWNL